jgi:arylformamidase
MASVYLSYPLGNNISYYGGNRISIEKQVREDPLKYNQESLLRISSHSGTHIDFPAHFYPDGKKGETYPPDFFIFRNIAVVDRDLLKTDLKVDGSLVSGLNKNIELVLIKTHFCEIRDQERYWKDSPVVASELADFIRGRFPGLRMMGMDLISLTSMRDKAEGQQAHMRFLDGSGERGIPVIEDMDLSRVHSGTRFEEIIVAPLFYNDMDGAPCTVIAKII